ncbi:unnamed protein product [Protopolystoma xenopodis]|uniref:Uncharacterized protein n=1 Tax=Protopolystoma xenopodis TaxID=117903 RepID=A0A3S5AQE2_9PLAT|nr:unnamed protein product [Protopolystoma xenopodis]
MKILKNYLEPSFLSYNFPIIAIPKVPRREFAVPEWQDENYNYFVQVVDTTRLLDKIFPYIDANYYIFLNGFQRRLLTNWSFRLVAMALGAGIGWWGFCPSLGSDDQIPKSSYLIHQLIGLINWVSPSFGLCLFGTSVRRLAVASVSGLFAYALTLGATFADVRYDANKWHSMQADFTGLEACRAYWLPEKEEQRRSRFLLALLAEERKEGSDDSQVNILSVFASFFKSLKICCFYQVCAYLS